MSRKTRTVAVEEIICDGCGQAINGSWAMQMVGGLDLCLNGPDPCYSKFNKWFQAQPEYALLLQRFCLHREEQENV